MIRHGAKPKVAIVDYQLANMFSVKLACEHVGLDPQITSNRDVIAASDAVVLPGVGAFGEAMRHLSSLDLIEPLREFIASERPFLGICLGMQLLFTESQEFGSSDGLGVIAGRVVPFPRESAGRRLRVPQIGWNTVRRPVTVSWEGTPLSGSADGEYMYFLHSYYVVPEQTGVQLCMTEYGGVEYCSGVASGNVFGLQFHPEKSAARGMDIYRAFASIITAKETQET